MADIEEPGVCEACGRALPPQQGRGRRRRYCDATCRSAARRERARGTWLASGSARHDVKPALTTDTRHVSLDAVSGAADPVASTVRAAAFRLADELDRPGAGSPLAAMSAARQLSAATDAALQAAVDRARAAGHSWQRIGDVLGTTRQAAFQRFGRPIDPRTGAPMTRAVPPGLTERAVAMFAAQAESRWEDVLAELDENMREKLTADRLAAGWAQTIGIIGGLERIGDPFAFTAGQFAIVNIPLHFEAGEANGRVTFDLGGKVAGLFIRPASP
jgi:Protein of unknown function (DUF3887)